MRVEVSEELESEESYVIGMMKQVDVCDGVYVVMWLRHDMAKRQRK